jgi:tetratricopeptide (TPR) repeat protein/transcriptional regulator with XRE-family HTH domain
LALHGLSSSTFGEQLKQLRRSQGLTQGDLALAAKVGKNTISELERGVAQTPHRETVRLIAEALALGGEVRSAFEAAARESALTSPQATTTRTLPRDIPSFTGRASELSRLLLSDAAERDRMVGVTVIEGMAGVGKTSLALHAAHRVADQFTDGQLFLDLRGYTDGLEPLSALEALGLILRWVGTPDQLIPDDLDERATFYRSRLAGTKTLIVLDNAYSAAQVRPLLPGTAGCLVIVTCRRSLRGLDDVHVVGLDELPEPDAVALFRTVAGPQHIAAGDPAVPEIVRLCGYLPLAIRIVAARASHRRVVSAEEILEQLRGARSMLSHLQDEERSLSAVFALSQRHLPQAERDVLRDLGQIPGADFDPYAAACLTGSDLDAAGRLLDSLLDHNLLTQRLPGRYQFHDLVRAYVRTLATDGTAALNRLLDYYLFVAQDADQRLDRRIPAVTGPAAVPEPDTSPRIGTADRANAWFAAELDNMDAAAGYAASHRYPEYAVALSAALAQYLRAQGPWDRAQALHRRAIEAAAAAGDDRGQAGALSYLGVIERQVGALAQARFTLTRAAELYAGLGDRNGQAGTLVELGITLRLTGDVGQAEATIGQALDLYAGLGDRHGRAGGLAELGIVQRQKGAFAAAESSLAAAMDAYRELGNRYGEAAVLAYLGSVQWALGDLGQARGFLTEALGIYTDLGDPIGRANTLLYLGGVHRETASYPAAAEALISAQRVYTGLGDRRGEAGALAYLGPVYQHTGDLARADEALTRALALFRDVKDRGGEAEALTNHAALALAAGDRAQARVRYGQARDLAREIGSVKDEADALAGLGAAALSDGQVDQARGLLGQALTLYRACGCEADAARVSAVLAGGESN